MVSNAKAPTRSYSYNLGVGCGLNSMTPGMAAQFWDDMGGRFKPKNEGF
jgi:hypothetical protein